LAGVGRRLGVGKYKQVPGELLKGSVSAMAAWMWLPTVTQSSPEEGVGRRRRRELGVGLARKLAVQTERV
jgi:hypothetical protein